MLQSPHSFPTLTLLFHFAMFPYHYASFSLTLLTPHALLSLTCTDSLSHEPSPYILPSLVRATSFYLFKNVVTGCISLT